MLSRLDYCKEELKKHHQRDEQLEVVYQQMNNILTTLREKKALLAYMDELKSNSDN